MKTPSAKRKTLYIQWLHSTIIQSTWIFNLSTHSKYLCIQSLFFVTTINSNGKSSNVERRPRDEK